jgi:hypothetical protein
VLDIIWMCVKDSRILEELRRSCHTLELLRLGNNFCFTRDEIKAYIAAEATNDVGTRRLKASEHTVSSYENLREWAHERVEYGSGRRCGSASSTAYPWIMEHVPRLPHLTMQELDALDTDANTDRDPAFGRLSEPDEANHERLRKRRAGDAILRIGSNTCIMYTFCC